MTAEQAAHVLIVDDEADMREMLCDLIESAGLRAKAVEDGAAMRAALESGSESGRYSLLILDLRLKREDGLTLARGVRATSAIPIMILTGKGDETDRILGLELGADDYVTKPFSPREVAARVRAILRREARSGQPAREAGNAAWRHDPDARRIAFHGQALDLTRYEYELLALLLSSPGRVFARERIMAHVWADAPDTADRSIDTHV